MPAASTWQHAKKAKSAVKIYTMAVRKKKSAVHPAILAIGGGAAGFGLAKAAIFGGNKLAAMPTAPVIVQKVNVGAAGATVTGVLLAIFSKNLAVQSAGIGMVTTSAPELYKDAKAAMQPQVAAAREQRMRFAEITEDLSDEPSDEVTEFEGQPFDLMQALAIAEDLED